MYTIICLLLAIFIPEKELECSNGVPPIPRWFILFMGILIDLLSFIFWYLILTK